MGLDKDTPTHSILATTWATLVSSLWSHTRASAPEKSVNASVRGGEKSTLES